MGDQEQKDPQAPDQPNDPETSTGGEPGAASVDPDAQAPDAGQQDPDDDAGPAVDPIEGDQGAQADPTQPFAAGPAGDPANTESRISAPPVAQASGVPGVPENADVEPSDENRGPVGASEEAQAPGGTDGDTSA